MQYVKQEITDFVSTNLTDIYADWSPTTTYILETNDNALTNASVVRYGTYYYRSVTNGNLNFNPIEYENIKWVKFAVSNKFAMLDLNANSKSIINGGDLTVTFYQNQMSVLGIGNYEADSVTVDILAADGATVLWTYDTPSNVNRDVIDYYTYIYSEYLLDTDYTTKINLPILGRFVRVTFYKLNLTNNSACGYLIGGNPIDMGYTLKNVNFSYNSFALKEQDAFGTLSITKRAVQQLRDFETVIGSKTVNRMMREIKKIYNDSGLVVLDESPTSTYENLMLLGVIQDVRVVLDNDVESIVSFSVMEAI